MKKTLLSIITLSILYIGASAQNVNIPDANFKAYLVGNTAINTNMDTLIQVSEANAFTGTINASSLNINDLTGIEAFTTITTLFCNNNQLTTLDVSQNTALTRLDCHINQLTALNVSQNLTLDSLRCYDNQIVTLDLSQHTMLIFLSCSINQLTVLNIANGNNANFTAFNAVTNPNLTCVQVDDAAFFTANFTNIDPIASFSENCNYLVDSIFVQGEGGISTISTSGGTLQMEASILPTYALDNTYTWSITNGTGSASINASGLLTAITDGTVTVTATANDTSGVTGSTVITISNQSEVGINEQTSVNKLSIYPNPVSSQLTIDSDKGIKSIKIVDMMGKTIKTISTQNNTIDVSTLTKGIYFLQIETDKGVVNNKFVKE